MTDQELNKKACVDWLSKAEGDFTSNLVELEGYFQSVPDEVCNAFERLDSKGRVEVIYRASSIKYFILVTNNWETP